MFYLIGYVDSKTSLMLAAGPEKAKAVSSNRVDKRFAGEVVDDPAMMILLDQCKMRIINYHLLHKERRSQKKKKLTYKSEEGFYFV